MTGGLLLLWVLLLAVAAAQGGPAGSLAPWSFWLPELAAACGVAALALRPGRPVAPLGPREGTVWHWTPPPGWPVPAGFVPEPGWQPDPAWPDPPAGWRGWTRMSRPGVAWPLPAAAAQDGTFVHDGWIWWPLRTPDGARPVVRAGWGLAGPRVLGGVGALLLVLAPVGFVLAGLMSMGAAPDRPPDPGAPSPYVWSQRFMAASLGMGVLGFAAVLVAPRWSAALRRPRLASGGLAWVWTPAPGWPAPSAGFTPTPGWHPSPSWPAPPADWRGWSVVPDARRPAPEEDGTFVRDGALWWPLRTPDGRRPLAAPAWQRRAAGAAPLTGALLLTAAGGLFLFGGLLSSLRDQADRDLGGPVAVWPVLVVVATVGCLLAGAGLLALGSRWQAAVARPRLRRAGLEWTWSPPSGWPLPADFTPGPGWQPDPAWPQPAPDWRGWTVTPSRR